VCHWKRKEHRSTMPSSLSPTMIDEMHQKILNSLQVRLATCVCVCDVCGPILCICVCVCAATL
jgi:hypothetical protein